MLVEAPQLKIAVEAKTHKIYFLTTELRRVEPRLKEESAQTTAKFCFQILSFSSESTHTLISTAKIQD